MATEPHYHIEALLREELRGKGFSLGYAQDRVKDRKLSVEKAEAAHREALREVERVEAAIAQLNADLACITKLTDLMRSSQ